MTPESDAERLQDALSALALANRRQQARYPGERIGRQPVHTVYAGAQLFHADIAREYAEQARQSLQLYAADAFELAGALGIAAELAPAVYERVQAKLQHEAVEDFRIDFEDGFGARTDAEEDAAVQAAAEQVALGLARGTLPPFIGIRIKSFGAEWVTRAARTLELFIATLLAATGGRLPDGFVVTLPKVSLPEQPRVLVRLFEWLERRHGLPSGCLRMEIMIEVNQALIGSDGRSPLPDLLWACEGRCVGAHFGTYDFTTACGVTAAHQRMDHPLCDLAKGLMVLAYAGTGIQLSDGSTNVLPVPPHAGADLTPAQQAENRAVVHNAWRLAHRHNTHSLRGGFYQGWDLHPAQLPVRYASCYAFFLEGLPAAATRLRQFLGSASAAALSGDVLEDVATGQALLNYFVRARLCGAIDASEVASAGLTAEELALRSFAKILDARRAGA